MFAAIFTFFLSGCVKVQLLPEDAVKNTFKAGKNLYDESKLKRQGGVKREYSSQVVVDKYVSREEAETNCMGVLSSKLEAESTIRVPVVVTERVIVVDGVSADVIECQLTAYIWPQA
ncbi:MAG: hypothetical protein ACI9FB_004575 [Candidatus Azotimanducaceae bacterium]|jgi:hypothetical protein